MAHKGFWSTLMDAIIIGSVHDQSPPRGSG